MDFERFKRELQGELNLAAKEWTGGEFIHEGRFKEENDIIFYPKDGLAGIPVNTMDHYAAFQAGWTMEAVTEAAFTALKEQFSEQEEQQILERMAVPENIVPVLIPRKGNEKLLEEIAHIPLGNMEIMFKFILLEPIDGMNISCSVPKSYIEECGWNEETLLEVAMGNRVYREEIHVMPFKKMTDALILGDSGDDLESDWEGVKTDPLKIVLITNSLRLYGAAGILDKDTMQRICDIYESDLYILPVSLHECLAVPKGKTTVENLRMMTQEINESHPPGKEWLSDDVYLFERYTREIRLAVED